MGLLTEEDVRRMSDDGRRGPVVVGRGEILSPSARDYLRAHRVEVVYPQGREGKYRTLSGESLDKKPEHMTHLKGNLLVEKDHPRIALRGEIDALEAELLLAQLAAEEEGLSGVREELGEVLDFVRGLIRCDVLDEAVKEEKLCGYTMEQLREYSHYPDKHLGQPHFLPAWTDGAVLLSLNRVRTTVRRAELAAYRAYRGEDGRVEREDILRAFNRLSSLLWIMMIKCKAGKYERGKRT